MKAKCGCCGKDMLHSGVCSDCVIEVRDNWLKYYEELKKDRQDFSTRIKRNMEH
jgi:hypothetical protein